MKKMVVNLVKIKNKDLWRVFSTTNTIVPNVGDLLKRDAVDALLVTPNLIINIKPNWPYD